jgi:hypothetical protein
VHREEPTEPTNPNVFAIGLTPREPDKWRDVEANIILTLFPPSKRLYIVHFIYVVPRVFKEQDRPCFNQSKSAGNFNQSYAQGWEMTIFSAIDKFKEVSETSMDPGVAALAEGLHDLAQGLRNELSSIKRDVEEVKRECQTIRNRVNTMRG